MARRALRFKAMQGGEGSGSINVSWVEVECWLATNLSGWEVWQAAQGLVFLLLGLDGFGQTRRVGGTRVWGRLARRLGFVPVLRWLEETISTSDLTARRMSWCRPSEEFVEGHGLYARIASLLSNSAGTS